MYNLDELKKTKINVINGYIKLPEFFNCNEKKYYIVTINNQIRLYNEKEFKIFYTALLEELSKIEDYHKRRRLKTYYTGEKMNYFKIPKNKLIKITNLFFNELLESIYVVGNESHLRFFIDELEYQKYYEKNNNKPKRIH